jgi:hypothetical protein
MQNSCRRGSAGDFPVIARKLLAIKGLSRYGCQFLSLLNDQYLTNFKRCFSRDFSRFDFDIFAGERIWSAYDNYRHLAEKNEKIRPAGARWAEFGPSSAATIKRFKGS